jgi:hypothetical protein
MSTAHDRAGLPATTTQTDAQRHDVHALRAHLFATIQAVRSGQLELDKARTINEVAKTLTELARVEVDFLRATDGDESEFLKPRADASADTGKALPPGIVGVTVHRLK